MLFPKNLQAVIRAAAEEHENIDDAVDAIQPVVRGLPNFVGELRDLLVTYAIRALLADARHVLNDQMKRAVRNPPPLPKVIPGRSKAVQEVCDSLYKYRIAGTFLGNLRGEQLLEIAEAEQKRGEGHLFNSRLCVALDKLVPKKKRVQDAVSERKLNTIFQKTEKTAG